MLRLHIALVLTALALPLGVSLCAAPPVAIFSAQIVGAFTAGVTILLAWPLSILLVRKGWLRAWQAAIAGVIAGALVAAVLSLDPLARGPVELVPLLTAIGAIHGLGAWLLGVYGNAKLAKFRVGRLLAERQAGD